MKKAVVTALIGDYDKLQKPKQFGLDWDYYCFTNTNFNDGFWKVVKLDCDNNVKNAREVKTQAFRYLEDYDLILWHDANMQINCNLNEFVKKYHNNKFTIMKHPVRNCVYKEAEACIILNKDDKNIIENQISEYKEEGFRENVGMVASGVFIYNVLPDVTEFLNEWWEEISEYSRRDQLSFNYIADKLGFEYNLMPYDILSGEFIYYSHK